MTERALSVSLQPKQTPTERPTRKRSLAIIQTVPTPHNNTVIEALILSGRSVDAWYRKPAVQATPPLAVPTKPPNVHHYDRRLDVHFLLHQLLRRDDKVIIVGWSNANTLALHLLFFLTRRRFNHWTDTPAPVDRTAFGSRIRRWLAHQLLRLSNCTVLVTGKATRRYFLSRGFKRRRIVNMPIFTRVPYDLQTFRDEGLELLKRLGLPRKPIFIAAGSRLTRLKGYDLLISAAALLPPSIRDNVHIAIVGDGDERQNLQEQIEQLDLLSHITMLPWMASSDFEKTVAAADIFVHPARFDAYGGSIVSMAMGVATIASANTGVCHDRIRHDVNGLKYDPEDIECLASHITELVVDTKRRNRIASEGRLTALTWLPSRGATILAEETQ